VDKIKDKAGDFISNKISEKVKGNKNNDDDY
jgi:hypothetical protein